MATVGTFGSIVFETSDSRVLTFDDYSRSGSAKWVDHEVEGQTPADQFISPSADSIQFRIHLSASIGVNPKRELERLRQIRDTGTTAILILGGQRIGLYSLRSLSETTRATDRRGRIVSADVTVGLKASRAELTR